MIRRNIVLLRKRVGFCIAIILATLPFQVAPLYAAESLDPADITLVLARGDSQAHAGRIYLDTACGVANPNFESVDGKCTCTVPDNEKGRTMLSFALSAFVAERQVYINAGGYQCNFIGVR